MEPIQKKPAGLPIQKKPAGLPIVQLGKAAPPRHDPAPAAVEGGERIDLPITGMSCAACARRIETALAKAPGVHRAGVNLATSRATVEYDPARAGVRDFMRVVQDTGYGTAGTARADFVVDDSARPSGSAKPLQDHLLARRGVVSADFNLATMEVRVEYLPGAADVADVRAAIEELGYVVRDVPSGDAAGADSLEAAHAAEYASLRRKFVVASVLS